MKSIKSSQFEKAFSSQEPYPKKNLTVKLSLPGLKRGPWVMLTHWENVKPS